MPVNDFSTIPAISTYLIPASDGNLKPWFDQSQGADIVVDNNGELHIVCTISSGSSDDNDSLGYSWTLTGQNGTTAKHYIYDVHTSPTGWDAWLIDSLMTSTSTNNTIFWMVQLGMHLLPMQEFRCHTQQIVLNCSLLGLIQIL